MEKLKLRKSVKVVLTVIILMIAVVMYLNTANHGALAQTSKFYEGLVICEWFYILVGQMLLYGLLWEN